MTLKQKNIAQARQKLETMSQDTLSVSLFSGLRRITWVWIFKSSEKAPAGRFELKNLHSNKTDCKKAEGNRIQEKDKAKDTTTDTATKSAPGADGKSQESKKTKNRRLGNWVSNILKGHSNVTRILASRDLS